MPPRPLVLATASAALATVVLTWTLACHGSAPPADSPRATTAVAADCFEGEKLVRSWKMDETQVQWNPSTNRFEQGALVNGDREGCWTVWHKDGAFDSDASGTYANGVKVEAAPSARGDFEPGD